MYSRNFRNLLFLFILLTINLFTNCSKNDDNTNENSNKTTIDDVFFIKGNIQGKPFSLSGKLIESELPNIIESFGADFINPETNPIKTCNYLYSVIFNENTDLAIASGEFFFDTPNDFNECSDEEELKQLPKTFNVKTFQYLNNNTNEGVVSFEYTPKSFDGSTYSTYFGSQTGSSFNITSFKQLQPFEYVDIPKTIILLEGTMNCTLYKSSDTTERLELTEGTFRIPVLSQAPTPDLIPVNN